MPKEIKATLEQVLRFFQKSEIIKPIDLMNEFGYTYSSAVDRIARMEEQKLVEKVGIRVGQYCLTNEGIRRLKYYNDRATKRRKGRG